MPGKRASLESPGWAARNRSLAFPKPAPPGPGTGHRFPAGFRKGLAHLPPRAPPPSEHVSSTSRELQVHFQHVNSQGAQVSPPEFERKGRVRNHWDNSEEIPGSGPFGAQPGAPAPRARRGGEHPQAPGIGVEGSVRSPPRSGWRGASTAPRVRAPRGLEGRRGREDGRGAWRRPPASESFHFDLLSRVLRCKDLNCGGGGHSLWIRTEQKMLTG